MTLAWSQVPVPLLSLRTLTTSLMFFYCGDLADRTVLVGEGLHEFLGIGRGVGEPVEDVRRTVSGEGHADGIDHGGGFANDLDLDPFGCLVTLERGSR